METKLREQLLALYQDLRVADVRDGLDTLLHHWVGSMEPSIRPLFRTKAFGIARTCRYLPYRGTILTFHLRNIGNGYPNIMLKSAAIPG